MEDKPNYDAYSYQDLIDARDNIDGDAFPERAAEIEQRIQNFTEHARICEQDAPDSSLNEQSHKSEVVFHGNTPEYFRIWIVNLLLSIVTLGIYSAWATVRNNRYFYSNTEIDGHRFSYLATPMQILRGRIIGVALFGAYFLTSVFAPVLSLVVILLIMIFTPMLIVMSVRFRMRMTAYRNVRFNFNKDYSGAFKAYILLPILGVLSLYLAFPWVIKKMNEFVYKNITFGDKSFKTELETGTYYLAALASSLGMSAIFIVVISIMGGSSALEVMFSPEASAEGPPMSFLVMMGVLYLLAFLVAGGIWTAMIRNHIYKTTAIDHVASFDSQVSIPGLILLRASNTLALICTLGFAMPWVKVRTLKFYAAATSVNIKKGADTVIGKAGDAQSAVADEVSSIFDVDIAVG